MKLFYLGLVMFWVQTTWAARPTDRADEIVRRSVANMDADWAQAPRFDFTERDVVGSLGSKTYQVMMIEGSPYNKLIAINGRPISPEQAAREDRKLARETSRRANESPSARQKRIAEYRKERHQDHALMAEMVRGFDFKLTGQETVDGRRCFVLDATPKPGYQPPTR